MSTFDQKNAPQKRLGANRNPAVIHRSDEFANPSINLSMDLLFPGGQTPDGQTGLID